ncbi:MAG: PEP-utilizing enzyme, partial [Acidimicrobiales bacterium]
VCTCAHFTLAEQVSRAGGSRLDRWIADWTPSERWPHYTRANAGEVLAPPATPLGQTYSFDNGMVLGWRDGYVRQGVYAEGEMSDVRPEPCGFFGGYFYINLSNVRMQGVRNPAVTVEQLDMAFFGDHPDVPPYEPHPDDERPDLEEAILAHLGWVMTATEWPEIDADRETTEALRRSRSDLESLTPAELLARAREIQPLHQSLFAVHAVSSSSSGIAPGILFAVGEAIGDPTIPMRLVAGLGGVDSAEPSFALWDLSRTVKQSDLLTEEFDGGIDGLLGRLLSADHPDAAAFLADWDKFILEFGSRGPNEWEIGADSWETRPELALALLDRVRFQSDDESPGNRQGNQAAEREQVTAEVRAKLEKLGNDELSGQFEAALVAANMMQYRERTKTNLVRVVNEARVVFQELGRRMAAAGHLEKPDDMFMLLDEELEEFVGAPQAFTSAAAERARDYETLRSIEPPFFIINGEVPPISTWDKREAAAADQLSPGDAIQGVPGCPGSVRGRARVVTDPGDPRGLEPGDILIAPLTDPAWTPLFMTAGGVVVDVGGQISHAIIVSRELGLPCVVSATGATMRIPDGAEVEVNGSTGEVTLL